MSLPVAILAGGLATRMRPVTEQIPKALIDVAGKPFIVRQLELLQTAGIERVVLCIGHLGAMIREVVADGSSWGLKVDYSEDGEQLLGTGGALRRAVPLLGDAFFVLYGDSYLRCNYRDIEERYRSSGKAGLMTVLDNRDRWDKSNIVFRNGVIEAYDKHHATAQMHYIDYGLGVLSRESLAAHAEEEAFDLASVYQELVARGELAAYEVGERFYEIGSPSGLKETRDYFAMEERRQ